MAGSRGGELSDYLDRPDALHRRTASLAIARSGDDGRRIMDGAGREGRRARSSRLSLSSWLGAAPRSRTPPPAPGAGEDSRSAAEGTSSSSAWSSWKKPVRALSRIGKRRAGCLFSVEVAAVRGLPASMASLRLAVSVRKAESKDAMQTMPARVSRDGSAEFDETLFVRCNLYFTGGHGTGKPLKLEPRRFVVSVLPVEAADVRLGTYAVDVSALVLDSLAKINSSEGRRVRRFDRAFRLSGKAAGGELVLTLGFQLMDDAGLRLYNTQAAAAGRWNVDVSSSPSPARARIHSKKSFSIVASSTPKLSLSAASGDGAISPSMRAYRQLLDRLNVDDRRAGDDDELSASDVDYQYEVIDKGVEKVKEVVHFQEQRDALRELDSIAEQIEAIEALMTSGGNHSKSPRGVGQQLNLDADEEMVTVEFLRKLELVADDDKNYRKLKQPMTPRSEKKAAAVTGTPPSPVVPDLGQSLGPAVRTRDGGFLVSMNPFDVPLASRDVPPKLAMQVSRPFVLPSAMAAATGFDVLQKMAAVGGLDAVRDKVASLGSMESLTGKTPEQVGFEGIAEAVIAGRRTEDGGASATSSAARSVRLVRRLAAAVSEGRRERVATGFWSAGGTDPETVEEVLAFSLQKLEAMAVDALMVQAEMADEDAPFEVAAPAAGETADVFGSLVPAEEWWSESGGGSDGRVTVVAAVQLRDPSRRYEAVGAPMVAVVQSARMLGAAGVTGGRLKVRSLHVGGVQARCSSEGGAGGSASWRAEREKLTAMQWALAHGPGRAGRRATTPQARARQQQQQRRSDVVWSLSSRVLAGMWLKTVRNPDVKIGPAAGCSTFTSGDL